MTIVKGIYKWAAMLLFCALLVSCGAAQEELPPLVLLDDPILPEQEESAPTLYLVVTASDCDAAVWAAAGSLATSIADRTGVRAERIYEHEIPIASENPYVIYVGWVRSSAESNGRIRRLRSEDYLCRSTPTGLVLGGKTDGATVTAVERFCREILPAATASSLMHPDGGFSYASEEYGMDAVELNGFELHEYCIVYAADASDDLRELARAMRDEIAARSGYWLETLSEEEFDPSEKGIFLGTETPLQEGDSAYWMNRENGVLLTARSFFGITVAVEQFCAALFPDDAETSKLTVSEPRAFSYVDGAYLLGSAALDGILPFDEPEEVLGAVDPVLSEQPHAVFFGSVSSADVSYLTESLQGYIALNEGETDLLAYGKEGVLSFEGAERVANTDLTVSSYWVGDRWNGFRVVLIRGLLTEDTELSLSLRALEEASAPTVILTHLLSEAGTLSIVGEETLRAVLDQTYMVGERAYTFSCYVNDSPLQIRVENGDENILHRWISVERTSAF